MSQYQHQPIVRLAPRFMSVETATSICGGATLVLVLAVLGTFVGLLPSVQWRLDEYQNIADIRDDGVSYLVQRVLNWSPRPLSESILFVYANLVVLYGRPLIGWLLAPLWTAFLVSALLTVRWRAPRLLWRLIAGLGLLAMLIVARDPGEVFYWPQGAIAYLSSLIGLCFAFFILADGRDESVSGKASLTASLLLAAWSSEVGAIFGACYASLWIISDCVARLRHGGVSLSPLLAPAILLVGSLGVLTLMITHRGTLVGELPGGDISLMHRPLASLLAAASTLPLDLLGATGSSTWSNPAFGDVSYGVLIKLAFVTGFGWIWRYASVSARMRYRLVIFALACFATTLLALAASFYLFGQPCCSRHADFREQIFFLGLAALTIVVSFRFRRTLGSPTSVMAAAVLLVTAILAPFGSMIPRLRHDYVQQAQIVALTKATWESGHSAGPAMVFHLRPEEAILPNEDLPPGTYELDPKMQRFALYILHFFNKRTLRILPPPDGAS